MKTDRLLCLLAAMFLQGLYTQAQQWRFYNPTLTYDINTVAISKPGNITVGGGSELNAQQVIFNTPDYGYAWNGNTGDGLFPWNKSLVFADTTIGYGVGDRGRIIKTIDGGQDWLFSAAPIDRSLNKIVCVNSRTYFVAGGHKDSLQTILKSTDGGQTWNVIYDQPGPWLKAIYFIDTLKGFAVGDSGTIIGTANGGSTWSPVSSPLVRDFTGVAFTTASAGFITGGTANDSLRTILQTTNGGNTWTVLKDESGGKLNDIWFIDANTGYVTGDSATLLRTLNGGLNWAAQSIPGTTGNEVFNAVRFFNPTFGVVAGKTGQLYVYANLLVGELTQIQAIQNDSASRFFQATVNTHGTPSHLYFMLATDTGFTQNLQYSYQVNITNDSAVIYGAYVAGIHPNTLYYYKAILGSAASVITSSVYTFYNGVCPYTFKGANASNVSSGTAQLNAYVNKMPFPLQLKFNYGANTALGSQVVATPASINDTLGYFVTATISGLQPNTTYYYQLEGDGFTVFSSDTIGFYTGLNASAVKTFPGNRYNDTSVLFMGTVEGFRFPATVSFPYGTTPALGNEAAANPFNINDTALHAEVQFLNSLQPQTIYYYCIKAVSAADTLYGDTLQVYSGHLFSLFNTLLATNVTGTSVQLNGIVDDLALPSTLTFEYGPSTAFGSEVAAAPATVSDTLLHNVSVQLSGLPVGGFYYYRLKAVTPGGLNYYGETRQVFIGDNEIPNWDFEYWQNRIALVPKNWMILGKTAQQAPGHNGFGLKLNCHDVAVNSMFETHNIPGAGPVFIDGKPFHARPDSIWFYLNANDAPADTPHMLMQLYSGNTVMASNFYTLPANTGGSFQRVALPISYSSSAIPDSIVIGFGPCLAFEDKPCNLLSNITIDEIGFSPAAPALPNADFEDWFSYSYNELESWLTSNIVSTDLDSGSAACVTESYFNPPSDHAAMIQNYSWKGHLLGAEINLRNAFLNGGPSFPVLGRHLTFNGYYKFYPVNGDSLMISAQMYKHGQYMGGAIKWIGDSATSFTRFELPFLYTDSLSIPDSAAIQISAFSENVNGTSTAFIDKLSFDNPMILGNERIAEENGIKTFPNPAQNQLVLEMKNVIEEDGLVHLLNMNGQVVMERKMPAKQNKLELDLSSIQNGFYLLNVNDGNQSFNTKVAVIK